MKKKRGLKIAGGVLLLVVLLAVYLLLKNHNAQAEQEAGSTEEEEGVEIAAVAADDISRLTFEISGEDVSWVHGDDGWSLETDSSFPVDQDQMTNLTNQLESITASRTLENVENLD